MNATDYLFITPCVKGLEGGIYYTAPLILDQAKVIEGQITVMVTRPALNSNNPKIVLSFESGIDLHVITVFYIFITYSIIYFLHHSTGVAVSVIHDYVFILTVTVIFFLLMAG